jgi:hypothetical protein
MLIARAGISETFGNFAAAPSHGQGRSGLGAPRSGQVRTFEDSAHSAGTFGIFEQTLPQRVQGPGAAAHPARTFEIFE